MAQTVFSAFSCTWHFKNKNDSYLVMIRNCGTMGLYRHKE